MYETIKATINGSPQYGAYDPKNSNWKVYIEEDGTQIGNGFGNIFYFEPQEQDCVVEIDCGIGGNSMAIAPCGLIFSTYSSDVISGTAESWYEAWRNDSWPP